MTIDSRVLTQHSHLRLTSSMWLNMARTVETSDEMSERTFAHFSHLKSEIFNILKIDFVLKTSFVEDEHTGSTETLLGVA